MAASGLSSVVLLRALEGEKKPPTSSTLGLCLSGPLRFGGSSGSSSASSPSLLLFLPVPLAVVSVLMSRPDKTSLRHPRGVVNP